MRLGLITTFDLGESVGIGDEAFDPEVLAPAFDPDLVGFANPLGRGVGMTCGPSSEIVATWRSIGVQMVRAGQVPTGWRLGSSSTTKADFGDQLAQLVEEHPIAACDLTIYGLGTVYLRLLLGPGVPPAFSVGILKAFEHAGYSDDVSRALRRSALEHSQAARRGDRPSVTAAERMARLSGRGGRSNAEGGAGEDAPAAVEPFTRLALGIDPGDAEILRETCEALDVPTSDPIRYEYHGTLHFTWAACVACARTIVEPDTSDELDEAPVEQIQRILCDFQIAHVFAGTCSAFASLLTAEVHRQVADHVSGHRATRTPETLNQLRALALAVVSLTNCRSVVATAEDQSYFSAYDDHAGIGQLQRQIREASEVVFSVQSAVSDAHQSRRDNFLNFVVLLLTTITLLSVSVDILGFWRDQGELAPSDAGRSFFLAVELTLLAALLWALWRRYSGPAR